MVLWQALDLFGGGIQSIEQVPVVLLLIWWHFDVVLGSNGAQTFDMHWLVIRTSASES